MRTRTRNMLVDTSPAGSMVVSENSPQTAPLPNGTYPLYFPATAYKHGRQESITDSVTNEFRRLQRLHQLPSHAVDHTTLVIGAPKPFLTVMDWRGATLTLSGTTLPMYSRALALMPATIPPSDLQSLQEATSDALRSTQSQDGTSLFNFIVELAEMRQLIHGIMNTLLKSRSMYQQGLAAGFRSGLKDTPSDWFLSEASLKGSYRHVIRAYKSWKKDPWQPVRGVMSFAKTSSTLLASAHLTNAFAIKPFLADLESFERAVRRLKQLQEKMKLGKPIRTRSQRTLPINKTQHQYAYSGVPSLDAMSQVFIQTDITVSATCTATYSTTKQSILQEVMAYCDALGVFPTASRIYNAIPFSFVIDYFSNLGDIIDALDGREAIIRPTEESLWTGFKASMKADFVLVPHEPGSSSHEDRTIVRSIPAVISCSRSWYARTAGSSQGNAPLKFRLPSLRQGVNLSALAISMVNGGLTYSR